MQQNCTKGNYDLSVDWIEPTTYTPIQEYIIRWGLFGSPLGSFFTFVPTSSSYELGRNNSGVSLRAERSGI